MQEAIVAVVVTYAVWVVAKRYAPKFIRLALGIFAMRVATWFGWSKIAARFEPNARVATGCGTCNGCGSAATIRSEKQFIITPQALKQTIIRPQSGFAGVDANQSSIRDAN